MLIVATISAALAVFLAVCAIMWPSSRPMHLRTLPKAYSRPLTLMGYPTPPRVADDWVSDITVETARHKAPRPVTLRGVLVGYEAE